MLIAFQNVSKTYGDKLVLNQITLTVAAGQRMGLVGDNGVGKSTLLKIAAGEVEADAGQVRRIAGIEVGYLPQVMNSAAGMTVEAMLDGAMGSLGVIETRLRTLEAALATQASTPDALHEYGRLLERYERRGGYEREHRMQIVLNGLGLQHVPRSSPLTQLSGGEQARAGMAAILLKEPDLLLLDEPTNHLDFSAIEWLEEYLTGFAGGILAVSHDRRFLNRTVQSIVEIEEYSHTATTYAGGYDFYSTQKAIAMARWKEDYVAQQEEIHELRRAIRGKARQVAHNRPPADKDKFLAAFKSGRVDTAIARNVHAAEERLRRIEEDPVPRPPQELRINPDLDPRELAARSPLVVTGIGVSFGNRRVLRDVSFAISSGTRAAIIGPNGAGKSTLLKVIAGLVQPDCGSVDIAGSVILGYLDQQMETLAPDMTVFEAYRGDRSGGWEEIKAELLHFGLFTYPDLAKPVHTLSAGQKRKLQIACLIAQRANLLLLDEPANHVSLDFLDRFEEALLAFPGPIIAVSHDRHFLQRFANEVWALADGSLRRYMGSWEDHERTQHDLAAIHK